MTATVPAEHRLPRHSIIGYGAGDAANNLAFTTATMFLLIYYTDVAGIAAATVGTIFLVLRIVDAFADIAVGRLVDRVNTRRWGKFRPFLIFGSLPLLLLLVATFHVPQIGQTGMIVYAYLTYGLLNIAYSLVNIPYGSLAAAMTQSPSGRAKLATARSIGAVVTGSALGIFISPLLGTKADLQGVFTTVTISFVFIGLALYLFTAFSTKERVHRAVPHVTMRQSFATLKGNKPLLLLCVSSVLFLTGMISMSTAQIYLMRDVFDSLYLVPYLSGAQLVAVFAISPFVPAIVRRFGKRTAYIASAGVGVVGLAVAAFAPNGAVAFGALLVAMLGVLLVNMLVWAIEADTVEYGEWKTGVRAEGITYALFSFTRKTGQAVGGAVAAYAIGIGGYVAGASTQSPGADWGIRAGAAALPAVCVAAAALVMLAYPLTDKVHARIVAEIRERREAATAEDGPVAASLALAGAAAVEDIDPATVQEDVALSTAAFRTGKARPGALAHRSKK
ncbi:glucuronide transporter [Microbacterium sp. KR10-403]|uniref:glucuronide transporter n=1 Tax=Microbacterium sp. KR10-403 TaxID=3158581 RepID=UPI0032E46B5B